MNEATEDGDPIKAEVGDWLIFWAQMAVLGIFAVLGAVVASADEAPGDYTAGMLLFVGAIVVAFIVLRRRLDGKPAGCGSLLLVDTMPGLAVAIPLLTLIGMGGLLAAAGWRHGAMYNAGLALFAACALIILLSIKRVFDRQEAGR